MTLLWNFWHEKKSAKIKLDYWIVSKCHRSLLGGDRWKGRRWKSLLNKAIQLWFRWKMPLQAIARECDGDLACCSCSGLIWDFISFSSPQRASDCENDSIYKIHLIKEINWVFKMEEGGEEESATDASCCKTHCLQSHSAHRRSFITMKPQT